MLKQLTCEKCGSDKGAILYEHRYLGTIHSYCNNCRNLKWHLYVKEDPRMTEEEFRGKLRKVKELSDEMDSIMKKLLDAVELDGRFIEHLPNYQTVEGDLIPKWEKRSVICLWGENRNFNMNIHRHCQEMEKIKNG